MQNPINELLTQPTTGFVPLPKRKNRRRGPGAVRVRSMPGRPGTPAAKEVRNENAIAREAVPVQVKEARLVQSVTDHNNAVSGVTNVTSVGNRNSRRRKRTVAFRPLSNAMVSTTGAKIANMSRVRNARGSFNTSTYFNPGKNLLMAHVMPEKYPPMMYPDNFLGRSSPFKSVINVDLPLLSASYGPSNGNFPAGSNKVIVQPTFINPIWKLTEYKTPVSEEWRILVRQSAYTGLRMIDDHLDGEPSLDEIMQITAVAPLNILGIFNVDGSDPTVAMLPFKNIAFGDNSIFYGYSFNLTGGTCVFAVSTDYTGALVVNGLQLQIIKNNAPQVNLNFNLQAGTSSTAVAGALGDNNGDNMIGFRIIINPAAGVQELTVSTMKFEMSSAVNVAQLQWRALQFPNFETAVDIYQKYRVTAMSALYTFTGPTINNGGQIAGVLQRGKPALYDGTSSTGLRWTYPGISTADRCYNGVVNTGMYQWWFPDDSVVMAYRTTSTAIDKAFVFPHMIAHVGFSLGTASNIGVIRLRVNICYECSTSFTFIPSFPTPPENEALETYIKRLLEDDSVPTSMVNDWHEFILQQLGNVNELVTKGVPLVGSIANGLMPLAGMLGFL